MKKATLKGRLFRLAGVGIALPLMIICVGIVYYNEIEAANGRQQTILQMVQSLQEARVAEKAYLQFYDESYHQELEQACHETLTLIQAADLNQNDVSEGVQLDENMEAYRSTFAKVVDLHEQSDIAGKEMHTVLDAVQSQLDNVATFLQEKEFELVLEGETLSKNETSLLTSCREAKILSLLVLNKQQNLFLTGTSGQAAEFQSFMKNYGQSVVAALLQFSAELGNEDFSKAIKDYPAAMEKAQALLAKSEEVFLQEQEMVKELDRIGTDIINLAERYLTSVTQQSHKAKATSVTTISAVTLTGLGILCVMSVWIIRSITRPLKETTDILRDIAQGEGDLTKRLNVRSNDELGKLAQYFNEFVDKLQVVIRRLSVQASDMATATTSMSDSTQQVADRTMMMGQQASNASSSTDTISQALTEVTQSSQQMSDTMNSASTVMEQMTSTITEIAQSAEEAAGVAHNAARLAQDSEMNIKTLGEAADKIGMVVTVIQDIAEQTNLLALNATIEAARAGDAGKGFAVVANEVKELARQTGDATGDISRMIGAIQESSGGAVESIMEISKVIDQVNEVSRSIASAVEEQSITTQEVATKVSMVVETADNVTHRIADTSAATQEMNQNVLQVNDAAQHTQSEVSQNQERISQLSTMADELRDVVGQFKIED